MTSLILFKNDTLGLILKLSSAYHSEHMNFLNKKKQCMTKYSFDVQVCLFIIGQDRLGAVSTWAGTTWAGSTWGRNDLGPNWFGAGLT